jgi:hypothetical protein
MQSLAFLCLILGASALKTDKRAGVLNADAQDMDLTERPVAKVVKLLKDMTAQLNKEAEDDAEAYESMACWCETGDKQKAKAIADGQQKSSDLAASIEELTAKGTQLRTDIETLEASVAEQTAALTQATAIRDKERAEFVAEEKEMITSITSLKGAVITLSKAHSEIQTGSVLQLIRSHANMHKHAVPRRIFNLIQVQQKTPASGEIFGVLKQMKESFETNLKGSQEEEVNAEKEYASLKAAKTKEIAAANGQIEDKQGQLGDTDEANAQAQQDKKDTEAALAADIEFLGDLKDKCAVADSEYAARVKVRTEEIAAVSDTINILTSEEANDAFTKSMTFVQKGMKRTGAIQKATEVLRKAGQNLHSPQLATLAMSLKLDAFAKVKQNIDEMVVSLKEESADEVADRDQCIKDLNINTKQAAAKADAKADLDAKIASLESEIADLTGDLKALNDSTFNAQVQMQKATANRAAENKDFTETIQDQRATQAILEKAVGRLKEFYDKKAAALVQEGQPGEALPPPPAQKTYAKQNGGGAVAMIMDVMQESKDLENQAIADETTAQAAYEGFMKDSNKLITANTASVANKSEAKAKADAALALAKGDLETTVTDILALDDMAKSLHDQCDFLLDHFTERQAKRSQEIDALNQAKAIFSGMKF